MSILEKQKQLFLVDGLGALLSAFLLGIVLVQFVSFFGIPQQTLYILAVLPCCFAGYDAYCYFKIQHSLGIHLSRIAIANLCYCCLSIGLALYHHHQITIWGWLYLLGEVVIVSMLARIELRVARQSPST